MLARRVTRVVTTLLLAAGMLLGALLVLPALAGYQRYVIVSGSMTGTYDRGSVVFDRVVSTRTLHVGDVITYRPPAHSWIDHLVTHRIHAIATHQGVRVYRTKGDANAVADPWTFRRGVGQPGRDVRHRHRLQHRQRLAGRPRHDARDRGAHRHRRVRPRHRDRALGDGPRRRP